MKISTEMLRTLILDLFKAKAIYLGERGWKYTCSFPDSIWRYTKEIDGTTLALPMDDAFRIEDAIACRIEDAKADKAQALEEVDNESR